MTERSRWAAVKTILIVNAGRCYILPVDLCGRDPTPAKKKENEQKKRRTSYVPAEGTGVGVLTVHPGGPFWAKKDREAWSIPKGEYPDDEDPMAAALREFQEETGLPPIGEMISLGQIRQAGGKVVTAWAFEGDCDPTEIRSNLFSMEWPPKSGRIAEFPEVDRAEWFPVDVARTKILKAQLAFLDRLSEDFQDALRS